MSPPSLTGFTCVILVPAQSYITHCGCCQGMRGHWDVYYTSFLIRWLNNCGDIGWFIKMSVKTIHPLIGSIQGIILCIIIGDVHQSIGHCLIPLDL